jgi:hypothetical protein
MDLTLQRMPLYSACLFSPVICTYLCVCVCMCVCMCVCVCKFKNLYTYV